MDLFHWESNTYLLVGDTYSRSPFVRKLTSLSSNSVICQVKGIFEEHGIPEMVLSDKEPQFSSTEFSLFAYTYGFQHVTTSPHFPSANGFIEKLVGTVKRIFTKCKETGQDPHLALLAYRATPLSNKIDSPAELLSGRRIKTTLLCRPPGGDQHTKEELIKIKQSAADRFNKTVPNKPLQPLVVGQNVNVRSPVDKTWEPAKVVEIRNEPRSYVIQTDKGEVRRNRRDLKPTKDTNLSESSEQPTLRRSSRSIKPPQRLDA